MDFNAKRALYEVLMSEKAPMLSTLTHMENFVMPFRGYFNGTTDSEYTVRWSRPEIYDSTAILGNLTLASNIHSNLTNPATQWFNVVSKHKRLNRVNEARVWLEHLSDFLHQSLHASNFDLQANETFLDTTGFGTALIMEEAAEDDRGRLEELLFTTLPIEECVYATDHRERVITFFRLLRWTPLQIISRFGVDNVPKHIREAAENPQKATLRRAILFSVTRRQEISTEWASRHRRLPPNRRPFEASYHLYDTGERLWESGYYEMPVFAVRWRSASGSVWGFSQGMVVLADILTLNKFVELNLKIGEKVLDPPALVTRRGVHSDVHLEAGGVTVVDNKENVSYLQYQGRYDIAHIQKRDLQESIQKAYFTDQLQLKESPAMTATEVQVRYQLMHRLMGPSAGRMQNDFLEPVIERTFSILYRYGLIPPPPEAITQAGADFEIEYTGPMARAQRFDTVASIERWIMAVSQLAQVFPNALDVPDIDETVKELGYSAGVPAKLVKSDSRIMLERLVKQKQQQQQQEMGMLQGAGQALKLIGEGAKAMSNAG